MRNLTKIVLTLVAVAGLTFSTGCKSDCEKLVDHMVELAEKEKDFPEKALEEMKSDDGRKEFVEECNKEGKPDEIECSLKAESLKDMMECGK